jgi:hypothetical protein
MYLRGIQGSNEHVDDESVCNKSVITRQGPILLDQLDKLAGSSPFRAHLRTQVLLPFLSFALSLRNWCHSLSLSTQNVPWFTALPFRNFSPRPILPLRKAKQVFPRTENTTY